MEARAPAGAEGGCVLRRSPPPSPVLLSLGFWVFPRFPMLALPVPPTPTLRPQPLILELLLGPGKEGHQDGTASLGGLTQGFWQELSRARPPESG